MNILKFIYIYLQYKHGSFIDNVILNVYLLEDLVWDQAG